MKTRNTHWKFHVQSTRDITANSDFYFPTDLTYALINFSWRKKVPSKFFWYSNNFLSAQLFASHLVSILWKNMYHHHWCQRLCWFGEESIGPKYHGWDRCTAMKDSKYKINSPTDWLTYVWSSIQPKSPSESHFNHYC